MDIGNKMKQYIVERCADQQGWWRIFDTLNQVECVWEEGKFNETQKLIIADEHKFMQANGGSPLAIARVMREIGDYIVANHYDIAFGLNSRQLLGYKIAKLRNQRGITIRELASLADVSPATIVNIEQGKFSPRIEVLESILAHLDAKIEIKENLVF